MEKLKRAEVQKSTKQINSTKVMPNFVANCTSYVSNIASCNHINICFINMYKDFVKNDVLIPNYCSTIFSL